ncbi:MAG TPA: G1 family glutamic endopeptidase [Solirubrobacteraceae bacterium]|nr:G1 family glutamic endopeptidase [Solirubrobacteraceae bacterium]
MQKTFRRALAAGALAGAGLLMAGLPAGSVAGSAIFHHQRIPLPRTPRSAGWSSSNWSGYAVTGSGFTSVTARWTVQAVSATRKASYSSEWAGIDGYNNSSLIQTGTESDYYSGSAHYDAWWEILPAAETVIPSVPVKPGDAMTATITKGSGSSWTITINDVTTGKSFTTTQTYSGPQTSAEWIEEAPTVGGRVAPLAHYGEATFDPGTVNGGNPHLTASEGGAMVQSRVQVSTPSAPDSDTDGFNVAYGSTAPAPPSS